MGRTARPARAVVRPATNNKNCVQVVYKKTVLKGLKLDLAKPNQQPTRELQARKSVAATPSTLTVET